MRHNPLLLSDRAKKVLNHQTIVIYHGLLSLVLLVELAFGNNAYTRGEFWALCGAIVFFALLGTLRFFNVGGINNRPVIYLIFYHLTFMFGFAFSAPAHSPYIFLWLVLLYISSYFFGIKGFISSISLFAITISLQSIRVMPDSSSAIDYIQFIGVQVAIMTASSLFFVQTEEVSDKDRKLLVTTIDKAQLERQRLISLINSMADGVIATDDKGIVKLYNAAALNILDTNESLQDKDVRTVMKLIDSSAKTVDPVSEAAEKNTNILSTDLLLVYPDGEKINVFFSVSPIKIGFRHDAERGFIISFRDITREKSLEEERNEFISVVSHELRTPIAITEANISNAQFIVDKGNNLGAVKSSLEAAHKQALFLANMINDLSTLSRAERGKLDMKTEEVSPTEVLKSLDDDYHKEAATKGLELFTKIEGEVPEKINSNRLYVREIMQNFVTNAIKYTKSGSITITLRGVEKGIEFDVSDTGIGISKSDQKRVFDKFFRSEDFRTRESSGTGLGLYVTKKLMKLINGEISLKSKLNEGSTFTIFVPNMESAEIEEKSS